MLTRNGQGGGGGYCRSPRRSLSSRLGLPQFFFTESVPHRPGKALHGQLQFLLFVKMKFASIFVPRAPAAPKEGVIDPKTSQA